MSKLFSELFIYELCPLKKLLSMITFSYVVIVITTTGCQCFSSFLNQ